MATKLMIQGIQASNTPGAAENISYTKSNGSVTNLQSEVDSINTNLDKVYTETEVNNMLSWKLYGSSTTGTTALDISSLYNNSSVREFYIQTSYDTVHIDFFVPKMTMSFGDIKFVGGGANTSTYTKESILKWTFSTKKLSIQEYIWDNTNVTSSAKIYVYYR